MNYRSKLYFTDVNGVVILKGQVFNVDKIEDLPKSINGESSDLLFEKI
jgi:hypothetical protein